MVTVEGPMKEREDRRDKKSQFGIQIVKSLRKTDGEMLKYNFQNVKDMTHANIKCQKENFY